MHSKLAGHLPLQAMIANVIDGAREKLAAEDAKDEKKAPPAAAKKDEKRRKEEEEMQEKMSSGLDIDKLAAALDYAGDLLIKEADEVENGGESRQGGEQLATQSPTPGKQPYKADGSKKNRIPMASGMQAASDGGGSTQMPNDAHKAPGGAPYPASGVMKTAMTPGFVDAMLEGKTIAAKGGRTAAQRLSRLADRAEKAHRSRVSANFHGTNGSYGSNRMRSAALRAGTRAGQGLDDIGTAIAKKASAESSASDAVNYILSKMAESVQGGMTLDSASGQGPKPPSGAGGNDARGPLESSSAAIRMKKVEGKRPQKKMLSEVLNEPALTTSTDSKVQENLRNASEGGVKIAAAKAYLRKVAAGGCTCSGKGSCEYCMLKEAVQNKKAEKKEKDSNAMGMGTPSPMPVGGPPPMPGM